TSKPHGASSSQFSEAPCRWCNTIPTRGDRPKRSASSRAMAAGAIRRRIVVRAEVGTNHRAVPGQQTGMNATRQLHDLGQSLWLDNITRELLRNGTLRRYIDELAIT